MCFNVVEIRGFLFNKYICKLIHINSLLLSREISRAAGKVVTEIFEDENVGNNAQ